MKKSKKKSGMGKFVVGLAIGVGLGVLFAPKKGSETRAELKMKLDELVARLKEVDVQEVREKIEKKIDAIKFDLEELDKEKALDIAKTKAKKLQRKAEILADYAKEKGTPVLRDAAEEVRLKSIAVTKEILKKLEKEEQ